MHDPLSSTAELVARAFPAGVPAELVLPVVRVLHDHLSDRQLASVLATLTGADPGVALNEVYRAARLKPGDLGVVRATSALEAAGFKAWCEEA